MTNDVFISYRRGNGSDLASYFHSEISRNGFNCFFDINEKYAGEFMEVVDKEIKASSVILMIITEGSIERFMDPKDISRKEIEIALENGIPIMPISVIGEEVFALIDSNPELPECVRKLKSFNTRFYKHELRNDTMSYIIEMLNNERQKRFGLLEQNLLDIFNNNKKTNGISGYFAKCVNQLLEFDRNKYYYTGTLKFDKPFMNGKLTDPSTGKTYELNWDFSGVLRGNGDVVHHQKVIYHGDINNLKYEGNGTLFESDGIYEGQFRNGKKSGYGSKTYKGGKILAGEWVNDEFEGIGYIRYPDGTEYHGAIAFGEPRGYGTRIQADGKKYEGYFRKDKLDEGVLFSGGKVYNGQLDDGIPNGRGTLYNSDFSKIFDGKFKNGQVAGYGEFFIFGSYLSEGLIPSEIYNKIKEFLPDFDETEITISGEFDGLKLEESTSFKIVKRSTYAMICEGSIKSPTKNSFDIYNSGFVKVFEKK